MINRQLLLLQTSVTGRQSSIAGEAKQPVGCAASSSFYFSDKGRG
jgi:hypothetical protein